MKNIAIIGNGAYGTALAFLFRKKHHITVFGRIPKEDEKSIDNYGSSGEIFDHLFISITTRALGEVAREICSRIQPTTHIILAMKGLTAGGLLPIDECRKILPNHHISVLSGPGFAEEIIASIPVHLVLASQNISEQMEEDFLVENLTLDFSHDVTGVSWCGVLKNIYAIGAGMRSLTSGFDRVDYTREAVYEMSLVLDAFGLDPDTAHGPAGMGDMWICTTPHSRNFRYGAGDTKLRDQAEGYSASKNFRERFPELLDDGKYPIISQILKTIE